MVGYELDPISILQSINSPTRGELHAGISKKFQARIVTKDIINLDAVQGVRVGER